MASSLMTVLLVLGLTLWIRAFKLHEAAWRPWDRESFSRRGLLQMLRLGAPVGAQVVPRSFHTGSLGTTSPVRPGTNGQWRFRGCPRPPGGAILPASHRTRSAPGSQPGSMSHVTPHTVV